MDSFELFKYALQKNASDVHCSVGLPPFVRIDGDLQPLDVSPLTQGDIKTLLNEMLTQKQQNEFKEQLEIDFSYTLLDGTRVRANAFHHEHGIAAAFRIIPSLIPDINDLHCAHILKEIARYTKGLVLVSGATGSGKSTTLAAMIDYINTLRSAHIVTLEDPIEFIHHSKRCLVHQREVRRDTSSFNAALRAALREDPDVILVGELRDVETIRLAMSAAQTGHLVLASVHTQCATRAIHRIIDVFPGDEKSMIRAMLSESLQAVIAQTLVKKTHSGRTLALELLRCTPAVRNLIREDKLGQIYSAMQTGQAKGMHTLDQHLQQLVKDHIITPQTAYDVAVNKEAFGQ